MLEAAAVPSSLWSAVHGWFTPAVLFVLINLVIGTIAVASRSMSSSPPVAATGDGEHRGALLRAPSLAFDRLRSFSFSRFPATAPFDGATEPAELEREQARIERSRSETAAGEAPPAPRLPARLWKSPSEMSEFAHFAPAAEEVVVEARRPATARDAGGGGAHRIPADDDDDDVDVEEPPPVEVDARADDFIRQFREQLRLQRLDSVQRYRDMLRRGHHAGTG